MADDSKLSGSLKVTQDLLKTNRQINDTLKERSKIQKDQIDIASEIKNVINNLAPEGVLNALGDIQGALQQIGIDAPGIFNTLRSSFIAVSQLAQEFVNVVADVAGMIAAPFLGFANRVMEAGAMITNVASTITGAIATIAFFPLVMIGKLLKKIVGFFIDLAYRLLKPVIDGIKKFGKFALKAFKTLLPVVGQFASTLFNIGKALYSLPGIITTNLLNMADSLFDKMLPIIRAFEALKKTLGDPAQGLNRQTQDLVQNMGGLDFFGGRGARNLYTYFDDAGTAATAMGEIFGGLGSIAEIQGQQIVDMGIDFVEYYKGMGLTVEQLRAISIEAIASGKPLREVLHEQANMAFQMADAFGFTRKIFAQDMAKMIGDVKRFGTTSIRELGEATAYVKSLGLEVETLGKLVDKFLNFESAVESTARLAQAFGVNLDAMKMMKSASKGGAGALEELRRGFFAAGRDADKLNLAELQLLASAAGISEAEAKLALSMRNRGKSMEQIRKEAGKSEKQQLSQVEVLDKLSKGIDKIIRKFEHSGSLFSRFTQGFGQGILMNSKFIKSLLGMRSVADTVHMAGRRIGNLFVEMFPGVKEFLNYLDNVFDPKQYQKAMDMVTKSFDTFFKALGDPAQAKDAFGKLIKGLMSAFQEIPSYFQGEGGVAATTFLGAIRDTIIGAIRWLPGVITDTLNAVVDILSGKGLSVEGGGLLSSIFGESAAVAGELINPIIDALKIAFKDPALRKALGDVGFAAMELAWNEGIKPGFYWMLGKLGEAIATLDDYLTPKLVEALGYLTAAFLTWGLDTAIFMAALPITLIGLLMKGVYDSTVESLTILGNLITGLFSEDSDFWSNLGDLLYHGFNVATFGLIGNLRKLWNTNGDEWGYFLTRPLTIGMLKALRDAPIMGYLARQLGVDFDSAIKKLENKQAAASQKRAAARDLEKKASMTTAIPVTPMPGSALDFRGLGTPTQQQQRQLGDTLFETVNKLEAMTQTLAGGIPVVIEMKDLGENLTSSKYVIGRSP